LISASGYQAHTTSPSALPAFVCRTQRVHRIPHPTLVTIGQTPLLIEAGRGELVKMICPTAQGEFSANSAGEANQIERLYEIRFLAQTPPGLGSTNCGPVLTDQRSKG